MSNDVKKVTEATQELDLTSGNIRTIINAIDQVALQANLLARLMAADPACAGEVWRKSAILLK